MEQLAPLIKGDVVVSDESRFGAPRFVRHTVKSVWKNGTVVLDNGERYTSAGYPRRGALGHLYNATPERLAAADEYERRCREDAAARRAESAQREAARKAARVEQTARARELFGPAIANATAMAPGLWKTTRQAANGTLQVLIWSTAPSRAWGLDGYTVQDGYSVSVTAFSFVPHVQMWQQWQYSTRTAITWEDALYDALVDIASLELRR